MIKFDRTQAKTPTELKVAPRPFLIFIFFVITTITFSQITVINSNSSGAGSLQDAISQANSNSGADDIVFDNALIGSTISIDGVLLITGTNGDATSIDGDIDGDGDPDITIEPSGSNYNGIEIESSNCVISGLHIQGFSSASYAGIFIDGGDGNEIYGNYLGTDNTGNGSGTANHSGIYINNGATGTIIGDGTSNGMNIIGNNSFGIRIAGASDNTIISGNHIGIGLDGDTDVGNSRGIDVFSTDGTQIGVSGDVVNIISNNSEGIRINGGNNTIIYNNYIGVDVTGVLDRGNGGAGVYFLNGCDGGQVGNTTTSTRNVIAGNSGHGVHIEDSDNITILNNLIGLGSNGDAALGNNHGVRTEGTSSNTQIGNGTAAGRNIISANSTGINVGAGPTYIHGNYIGTDETGLVDRGNGVAGVSLTGGSGEVGGTTPGEGNIISGNSFGIGVSIGGFSIMGNYIGTNASGTAAIPNDNQGIRLGVGTGTNIGDGTSNGANLISGNSLEGIIVFNASVTGNTIRGNLIGVQADGVTPLGNNDHGIRIDSDASSNTIWENVIANNGDATGEVGISVDGSSTTGNLLTGNLIYDNFDGGISLSGSAHGSIAAPVISSTLDGDIEGTSISGATIEVYADAGSQGEQFLGTTTASGTSWSISIDPGTINSELTNISVIQIDIGNNTSEFSSSPLIQSYVVSNTNDSGEGSLRWCIANANASANKETISFNIPGSAPWQIDLQTELLIDNNDNLGVEIDGLTQPNSSFGGDMITLDGTSFSTLVGISIEEPDVEIYGLYITGFADGIETLSGSDNVIIGAAGRGNIVSGNTSEGLRINGGTNGLVQGNRIGTSIDGLSTDGNGDYGIYIQNSDGIQIGGNRLIGEGNIISGNGSNGEFAIRIRPSDNVGVFGNLIGTDINGNNDLGNAGGISIEEDCDNAIIGGFGTGQNNVISGCFSTAAIRATTFAAAGNNGLAVENNIIGLNLDGDTPIGNANRGISVSIGSGSSPDYVIRGNKIAATSIPLEISNLVGNVLIDSNYIGTDINGNTGVGFENSGDGISITDSHGSNTTNERIQVINNVIVNSSDQGIELIDAGAGVYDVLLQGNIIGEDVSGTAAGNGGSGIRIGTDAYNLEIGGVGNENIFSNNTDAGIQFDGLAVQPPGSVIGINSYYCNGTDGIDYTLAPMVNAPVVTIVNANFISGTSAAANGSVVHIYEIDAGCADNQGASYVGQTTMSSGNWNLDGTFTAANYFVASVIDIALDGISEFSVAQTETPPEINVYKGTDNSGLALSSGQVVPARLGHTNQGINKDIEFAIENTGVVPLTIDAITVTGSDFTLLSPPSSVGAGATENFTVRLSGATDGIYSDFVTIESDDPDEPMFTFPVTGTVGDLDAKVWWTDEVGTSDDEIGRSSLDGANTQTGYYSGFSIDIQGIAIDTLNNMVFWTNTDDGTIRCGRIGNSGFEGTGFILNQAEGTSGSVLYRGLDVDGTAGKVYWADDHNDQIRRVNFDGSSSEVLVSIDGPRDIALDVAGGKMYYIAMNLGTPQLWRANLDGTSTELLYSSGSTLFSGIDLDLVNNHVYWTESAGGISRADLDGSNQTSISANEPGGIALNVAEEKIYYIDDGNHEIVRVNFDGTDSEVIQTGAEVTDPVHVAIDSRFTTIQGVLKQDYYALIALYNDTDGANWTDNTNWLSGNPVSNWYGVTVVGNRVWEVKLGNNNLVGTIPPEIGDLTSINSIELFENQLSGTIPTEIGNLTDIQYLSFGDNLLTGTIPAELASLSGFIVLHLYNNDLEGSIPPGIWNMNQLTSLSLGGNQLTGSLPTTLGNLVNLEVLHLQGNQLTGSIPNEIGDLTNLTSLALNQNQLTGSIPSSIGNLINATILSLSENQLSGSLPPELGDMVSLEIIELFDNNFSGSIPAEIGNLSNLTFLGFSNNQLSGNIPIELANLTNLTHFWLDNNQLDGTIPSGLSSLINLQEFFVSRNNLTGTIPDLGYTQLEWISLANNNFTGALPDFIGNNSNLIGVGLANNDFIGSVPSSYTSFIASLDRFNISGNQLEELPDFSGTGATFFNVSNNRFTFEDLESNVGISGIDYSSQANIPAPSDQNLNSGDLLDVTISVGGSNNGYQWYKDGNPVSGQTTDNLNIASVSEGDQGSYHLEVTNTLVTGLTISSNPFEVTVADDNQPPTVLYIFYLDENSPNGTVIGSIEGSDPDGDDLSYSITSGNTNDAFDILSNGDLVVNDETALDFETTPIFNLLVEVSDGLDGVTPVDITINLNDIDENVLGMEEKIIALRLYPNPVDEVLTVEMKNGELGNTHVELYSLNGQKQPLRLIKQSPNLIKMDVSTLAPGVYRVVILFENHVLSENIIVR